MSPTPPQGSGLPVYFTVDRVFYYRFGLNTEPYYAANLKCIAPDFFWSY